MAIAAGLELVLLAVTSFVVGLSGALVPGPLFTVTVAGAARIGGRAGLLTVLGHGLVEVPLVVALALGLNRFLALPGVTAAIGIAGGLMLAWMGWGLLRSPGAQVAAGAEAAGRPQGGSLVLGGALASVSNPYWVLWWATVGTAYILTGLHHGIVGIVLFYAGHYLADVVWFAVVGYGVAAGRRVLGTRVYAWLLAGTGVFLIALAGYFIYYGFGQMGRIA